MRRTAWKKAFPPIKGFLAAIGLWAWCFQIALAQTQVPSPSPLKVYTPSPSGPLVPAIKKYVIQQDDTLWDLSGEFYGRPSLWPLFLKFNSIKNPDLIHPGQALLFPDLEVLLSIQQKTPLEVKEIREGMEKHATPVLVNEPPAAPLTTRMAKSVTEVLAKESPSPTPAKTPTFKITGSKTINLSYSQAIGGSGNGFTNTGFDRHETLRLQMEGQLNDQVKLTGHFAQSDLALDDDYDLTLSAKHWELYFGNFTPSLSGSQFLTSSLSTTGLRLTGKYDDWNLTALYGTPRGRSVYEKFFGNNSQGPYIVPDMPMVPGSEILWLNKQRLTRGVDYNLDYTVGYLTFINRIVLLTDLIEIQAQSRSAVFNTQVYGYRMEKVLIGSTTSGGSKFSSGIAARQSIDVTPSPTPSIGSFPATVSGAYPFMGSGMAPSGGGTMLSSLGGGAAASPLKGTWNLGQGYMRQLEQPDPNTTTITGRVAADTHLLELDSTLDFGPPLKLSGEAEGSLYLSSNEALASSKQGVAYQAQGDTFQGPFHAQGKISGTSPNFTGIGNPLVSGSFLEWNLLGDYKPDDILFAQADRTFQRTFATGLEDDTTTDHAEARAKPKGFPEVDYVYYLNDEKRPTVPFQQQTLRNTASLSFGLPANLSMKVSAEQESQQGTNLGKNNSVGGKMELASQKWPKFNFNLSGEWKLTNIIEASSNTLVPTTAPGNNIPSQTYTYTMEGKPLNHLSLTGKGTYSNAPPGPVKANLTETYQTDPFKWLTSNGSYSLDFQQTQVLGATTPDQVHTGSGGLELSPLEWLKLSAQPSFRLDVLSNYGRTLSQNFHQNYRAGLTPSFGSLSGDYTFDQFWTWDGSTADFPLNFYQQTETMNVAARKPLGKVNVEGGYKRFDQRQQNISSVSTTQTHSLNQTENDSIAWNANPVITFTLSHSYNQLNQDSPGQGNLTNPLLPNGADTFNTSIPTNNLNAFTYSHTFTGRVTEQVTKSLSIYEEGGYTRTVDVLQGGTVDTYSPAAGFNWKPGSFLTWTASYQYNGSSGLVSTTIQKAQTTLSASLNPAATLSVNWSWTRADNPFVQNQQGTASYTMNF